MEQTTNAFIKAFPITWVLTAVVAGILWIAVDGKWAYSYVLGSATTLMMMSMMYKSSKKVLEDQHPKASKLIIRNYVFRYLFYALILTIAALTERFEVIATAIGLLSFKVSLYISIWLEQGGKQDD